MEKTIFNADERFELWLEKFWEIQDNNAIDDYLTQKKVWDFLMELKKKGHLSTDMVGNLIHFREVALDIFYLLDKDFDHKLRKFSINSDM